MVKFGLLLTVLFLTCSCKSDKVLIVRGNISEEYNGTKIYFCPLPSPRPEYSDSTVIRNGKFSFAIKADSSYMAKLQVDDRSESAYHFVQLLYVGVEPGVLDVEMGSNSRSFGTPVNDRLQVLKNYIDSLTRDTSTGAFRRSELILAKIGDFVIETPNGVGGYYNGRYGRFFPDSTKAKIDSLGLNRFIPDVSTRKPRK